MSQGDSYNLTTGVYNSGSGREVPPAWSDWCTDDPERDAEKFAILAAERDGYEYIPGSARWVHHNINPYPETHWNTFTIAYLARQKYRGNTVPGCKACESGTPVSHYPMQNCRSGKRPHCTCDGCF